MLIVLGSLMRLSLSAGPDLRGRELGGGGRVVEPAHGNAGAQQFFPVARVGEALVEERGVGLEHEATFVGRGVAVGQHLDPDARQRAAFGEVEVARLGLHEFELGGMARPEGEGERNGVFVLGLYREDLSILARPELVGVCHND